MPYQCHFWVRVMMRWLCRVPESVQYPSLRSTACFFFTSTAVRQLDWTTDTMLRCSVLPDRARRWWGRSFTLQYFVVRGTFFLPTRYKTHWLDSVRPVDLFYVHVAPKHRRRSTALYYSIWNCSRRGYKSQQEEGGIIHTMPSYYILRFVSKDILVTCP